MNDTERRQWVDNDEGLYNWARSSGLSIREFIRQNRAEIDSAISGVTSGAKPAHYLAYGNEAGRYPTSSPANPYASRAASMYGRAGQSLLPR